MEIGENCERFDVSPKTKFLSLILYGRGLNLPGYKSTDIPYTRMKPWNKDRTKRSTFGFSLSTNQAREILNLIKRGEKVVLQAKVKATIRVPGHHVGVMATIPGTDYPDEEIILTAHLDHGRPGSHDNNSGCGTLLEVARALNTLIQQKAIPPPKRTIRFFWNPHVWGCEMLLSSYPELIEKIKANINIDCVGIDQTKISSAFSVILPPFSRASFLGDVISNFLDYVILNNNNYWDHLPFGKKLEDHDGSDNVFHGHTVSYTGYSDHVTFNSGSVGIPAVMLIDLPFKYHHTQKDELEYLDPTQLKRISFLAAATSYSIASLSSAEAFKYINEIFHKGRIRLEREIKLSKYMLTDSTKENVALKFKSIRNLLKHAFKREYQTLNSTKLFIREDKEAAGHLMQAFAKMRRFEEEYRREVLEFYKWRCEQLGIKPEFLGLTKQEKMLKKIVPALKPGLKGTFGTLNKYPGEKYQLPHGIWPDPPHYYELFNLMDGKRNMLEIVQAYQAEALSCNYRVLSFEKTLEYLTLLKEAQVISY